MHLLDHSQRQGIECIKKTGAPNEDIVQNQLNIALLNVL